MTTNVLSWAEDSSWHDDERPKSKHIMRVFLVVVVLSAINLVLILLHGDPVVRRTLAVAVWLVLIPAWVAQVRLWRRGRAHRRTECPLYRRLDR